MKRYLLFAGQSYYANGGWADWKGTFDTLEEAVAHLTKLDIDWFHVIDIQTLKAVKFVEGSYSGELPDFLKG